MEKEPQIPTSPTGSDPDEIDLIALAKKLWLGRKTIFQTVAVFALLGVLVALLSPKEFTSTSTIVPQLGGESGSKLGGLGGLAALAGVNLDMQSQGTDLSPIVYPQIITSIPFQLELMNTPLNFQDYPEPVTLFDYVTKLQKPSVLGIVKKYTVGLPGLILSAIKGKKKEVSGASNNDLKPLSLTKDQVTVQKMLNDMVSLTVNAKEGYLTITVIMSEPLVTAQLALKAQNLLQKYIIEFKIQKSQANLDFIQSSFAKAKKEFEQAQVKLAIATDRSQGFVSGLSKVETDRLQSQYTITFGVYQELAKQFEQAKIQVKKETPVFTVIDPPLVPYEKTKPKRSMIVIGWIFLGGVIASGLVFGKEYWPIIVEKWRLTNP
jgi:LPS O-antigen subunit length determinant protein (WzzB/FepE family)